MMKVIETYRLSEEARNALIRKVWKENNERWWKAFQNYKVLLKEYVTDWHSWRLSVQAMGTDNRDIWPGFPLPPAYPYELTKVDRNHLRHRVMKSLKKSSSAGELLR